MKTLFRYRNEQWFPHPPEVVWPFLADSARINELCGFTPYRVEEKADGEGRIRRIASGKLGPVPLKWEERFGEWQENRHIFQRRHILSGPMGRFEVTGDLHPEGSGTRFVFAIEIECLGILGLLAKASGTPAREAERRFAAIARMIRESDRVDRLPGSSEIDLPAAPARRRLDGLAREPAFTGLVPRLVDLLCRAPIVSLRSIRPLTLARMWNAAPETVLELFLAAQKRGVVAMTWDLLCPRCRGAKARVTRLHELPTGAHCSSCNIDYQRDFGRNVELTFHPEPWLRKLPQGELCLLGQSSTPHVKFQAEVGGRSSVSFPLSLTAGPYRFRTVEAGPSADAEIGLDDLIPEVIMRDSDISIASGRTNKEIVVRNETDRPLFVVVEDRTWTRDALTGERVIAMNAFRRLCPEQLLRPGDDVEIGSIAIMFTDLKGSTQLYEQLGDARAYHLVRDHFAFLSERIDRHHAVIVKTVGDAVMAAFHDPSDAVQAALAIQEEVAAFNSGRGDASIVLKLGLHAGPCICVTTANVLDYFGSMVNTASRLEHACQGGEIVISEAVLADDRTAELIADRATSHDVAALRGLSEPFRFRRVLGCVRNGSCQPALATAIK